MRGRFFGWDYLLCVIVLLYNAGGKRFTAITLFAAGSAAISCWLWQPPVITPANWGAEPFRMGDTADGVTQERYFFFWFTGFPKYLQRTTPLLLDFGWCQDGLEQRRQHIPVASSHTVGMHGFCLGTDRVLIDALGITDPLLARMPRNPSHQNWRPGHFTRLLPEGYCTSVLSGNNDDIKDPAIAAYSNTIRLLTQSDTLLSRERLLAIWRINTGGYRHTLQQIHNTLAGQFARADGPYQQQQALKDCPPVILPPALVEQLQSPGQ
jgi:hypothetical protein